MFPFFLHPAKDRFLHFYENSFKQIEVFRSIENYVDTSIRDAIESILGKSYETYLPPLAEYIMTQASNEKTSIMEAVSEIRNTGPAKNFRNWLGDMQMKLLSGKRADWVAAAKLMKQYKKVVNDWIPDLDIGLGATHERKRISIGLPRKLGIVEQDGLNVTKDIKDPIIFNRPLYMTFIASWYKD